MGPQTPFSVAQDQALTSARWVLAGRGTPAARDHGVLYEVLQAGRRYVWLSDGRALVPYSASAVRWVRRRIRELPRRLQRRALRRLRASGRMARANPPHPPLWVN